MHSPFSQPPTRKLVLLFCLIFLSQFACAISKTIEISEQELQEKISEKMPLVKNKKFVNLKLDNAKIDLLPGNNRVALSTNLNIVALGSFATEGSAKVIGSLKYKPNKGAFYLDDPEIVEFQLNNLPEKKQHLVRNVTQIILTSILKKTPIYKLKDKNLSQKLVKQSLKSVNVEDHRILLEFTY